jgi:class 3 adenylate cyclase
MGITHRIRPVLDAMKEAVHRYEGIVNNMQGDGIMALFGAPRSHEDHAVRGCLAALAMQDAVASPNDRVWTKMRHRASASWLPCNYSSRMNYPKFSSQTG